MQLKASASEEQKLRVLMLGQCEVEDVASIAIPFTVHALKEAAMTA